jgi:hypothetical protein
MYYGNLFEYLLTVQRIFICMYDDEQDDNFHIFPVSFFNSSSVDIG